MPFLALDPPALDPEDLAAGCALGDLQGDGATVQRGHGEAGAERGLGERDGDGEGEVAVVAPEQGVGVDVHDHEEVAGRTAVAAGPTAALEPDALAVGDAGRDADLHLAGAALDARPATRRARIGDHRARPPAHRAGGREREHPLVVVEDATSLAVLAGRRPGAGLGPGAVAGAAGHVAGEVEGGGGSGDRLAEREPQLGLEVGAPLGAGAAGATPGSAPAAATALTEQATEQVAEVGALEPEAAGTGVEATGTATTARSSVAHAADGAHLADLVVLLALGLVAHHVVGGRHLLEALLGCGVTRVGVGMELPGQLPVGARELLRRRRLRHAEGLVVVLLEPLALRCH